MDNVYIKSTGFTQTQVNDNVSATSWNANYDGNDAKLSMNINDNGSNEHIKVRMSNEDLMKILNVPTIQGPIDKRLRETFLRKPMVYALYNCKDNNNSSAQRPYLNDDDEDDVDDGLNENDGLTESESFTPEEQLLNKQSSLPLKIQTISPMIKSLSKKLLSKKSSLPTLKEISSHKSSSNNLSNHLSNRSSKKSLKRSLPTLTSSKLISPDDSRDSFEPVTKQHFRTSLSLRGGKKHKKTKKATRISTFLRRLKFN